MRKLIMINQPRRSLKTSYFIEKAIRNLLDDKTTIIATPIEARILVTWISDRMDQLKLDYYMFDDSLKLEGNREGYIKIIDLDKLENLTYTFNEETCGIIKTLNKKTNKFANIFVDEIYGEKFYKLCEINKVIEETGMSENPLEIRFTGVYISKADKYFLEYLVKNEQIIYKEFRYNKETIDKETYKDFENYYNFDFKIGDSLTAKEEETLRTEVFKSEFLGEFLDVKEDKIKYLSYPEIYDLKFNIRTKEIADKIVELMEI